MRLRRQPGSDRLQRRLRSFGSKDYTRSITLKRPGRQHIAATVQGPGRDPRSSGALLALLRSLARSTLRAASSHLGTPSLMTASTAWDDRQFVPLSRTIVLGLLKIFTTLLDLPSRRLQYLLLLLLFAVYFVAGLPAVLAIVLLPIGKDRWGRV